MFASSQPATLAAHAARGPLRGALLQAGQGRHCEASRQATAALLLPDGRPGAWLLLLAGSCVYVLVQAIALRLG